jgi:hypothetical protein
MLKIDWESFNREYKVGLELIKQGKFYEGFQRAELRTLTERFKNPFPGLRGQFIRTPIWTSGDSIKNKAVIVWAEAGYGDMIQFARFIPLVKQASHNKVYVSCASSLTKLFSRLDGIDGFINTDEAPAVSYRVKSMSLPCLLMEHGVIPKEFDKIYGSEGVFKNQDIVAPKRNKPLVGLCWFSDNESWNVASKRFPLEVVQKFVDKHTDYDFVSLQLSDYPLFPKVLDSTDWSKTADKVQELDYVITVDSAIAHCAASVGVKTINMVGDSDSACWRWIPGIRDTYWYDTMQLVWGTEPEQRLNDAATLLPKQIAKPVGRKKKHDTNN